DVSHRERRGTGSLTFRSHGRSVPREGHFVFRQHPQTNAPADALGGNGWRQHRPGKSRAPTVLNNFRPRELWVGALPNTPVITALLAYAGSLDIHVVRRSEGENFEFGGTRVAVLSPPPGW